MDLMNPRLDGTTERKTDIADGDGTPMRDIVQSSRPTEMTPGFYVDTSGLIRNQLHDRINKPSGAVNPVGVVAVAAAPTSILAALSRAVVLGAYNADAVPRILYLDNGTAAGIFYTLVVGAASFQPCTITALLQGQIRAYWDVAPPAGSYVAIQPYTGW